MALNRIQFSKFAAGTSPYTLTYNPADVELPQIMLGELIHDVPSLDGDAVSFTPYFDARRGKLIWHGFAADHVNFSSQLSTLLTYVGEERYVHFQDLGNAIGHYNSWTRMRIVSIDRRLRTGGAFIWDYVALVFEETEGTGDIP